MATISNPQTNSLPKSKISTTFGLSKDLSSPVTVKVCYLESTLDSVPLVPLSTKFEDPSVFKKLSQIYKNSDLFVEIRVYDGKNNNLISTPVRTSYKAFNNKLRVWNQFMKLNIDYNQVSIDSYLKLTICEYIDTKPSVFGVAYLSLFNHTSSTLRNGSQKVAVYTEAEDEVPYDQKIQYGDMTGLTELEESLIEYENGKFLRLNWLDKMVLPKLRQSTANNNKEHDYYLYVELPQFEFPIVYSDVTYKIPTVEPLTDHAPTTDDLLNSNIVINSIEIPMATSSDPKLMKVYDPDFQITANNHANPNANIFDPIELKYRKLERNINNNSILDKELKPTPELRDELLRILVKPSDAELSDNEKNLIWKFRYYFSKNNSVNDPSNKSVKSFLPKFLKSINWENDYELDHTFKEIIPYYWSVDKLQIGDALDLLGDYFNPYTLAKPVFQEESVVVAPSKDSKLKDDEKRFLKIFNNVCYLRKLAVERLRLASSEELLLYLLQLVQALKYEALIYEKNPPNQDKKNSSDDNLPLSSPLANFLIETAVENEKLGNFFYWYVKVENEDQLNNPHPDGPIKIYSVILNRYIEMLKTHSHENKLPYYKHLKRQIWFIKKLTGLVELLRASFKKNEATARKVEYLREYLASSGNELLKFPEPFPLPLDPSIMICGCYPEESSVFKSSLAPLKITLKTIEKKKPTHATSQIFGKKSKYGKYPLMFKIGDDLRQDQLVIQIINLMDQLLKNENLDLKLTPYKILATSPIAGLIQFVPNETLDSILSKSYPPSVTEGSALPPTVANNGILNYLRLHSQEQQSVEPVSKSILSHGSTSTGTLPPQPKPAITSDLGVSPILMDNYVKSCAGYCVITYILGVGDRHLDNLLLSPNGKFWHADFGYILGRDPKPFPPLMKLPIQVIDGMGGLNHENYNIFKSYCFITYTTLRKNSNLILNLFQLMLDANIPDIQFDPLRVIEKVQEKFCLQMTEEEAILHFQDLINDSVSAFLPVVIDRLHSLAQYWRA
ncbi:Phosphatidylinositol 3-kinase VPS34 [Candida viswanathii]|uniref:Phosphatidylinositol 3-kinase VPS34 n=1 Tax=Candida viswanathii TaxID=5486 RepID=A0A367Y481_9ASCO|nr:Phosphatidylinositol 3-kinase VPS34 [Candida viswanathii]